MPLIEYECVDCHKRVEKIQSFSAAPATVCPSCGGKLEQTISAPAVQFKGSGWYVTDYARSGEKKKSSDGGPEAGKDSPKDAGKDSGKDSGKADVSASADSGPTKPDSAPAAKTESAPTAPSSSSSSSKSE
jgi:putative FmdB family regulatory protein